MLVMGVVKLFNYTYQNMDAVTADCQCASLYLNKRKHPVRLISALKLNLHMVSSPYLFPYSLGTTSSWLLFSLSSTLIDCLPLSNLEIFTIDYKP